MLREAGFVSIERDGEYWRGQTPNGCYIPLDSLNLSPPNDGPNEYLIGGNND